ncbi:MAG: SixA phosphatase family protein [Steroidobacteraceae bacterium]
MRKEYASLRRRPLLAPVWLAALAGIVAIGLAIWLLSAASTTTVFVMRHAEKAATPGEDPPLSPVGEARALALAEHFGRAPKGIGIDSVIVSEFRRTQETVRPLANRLGVPVIVVPAKEPARAVRRALDENRGGRVLIVGHSNTVPAIVEELSGEKVPEMSEAEYGIVYVVAVPRFSRAGVTRFDFP